MLEKKYCLDFDSNISFIDVKVEDNTIHCDDPGFSLYKIYVWQQLLINELLDKFKEVVLSINYIELGYVRDITFTNKIELYDGRIVSDQCEFCKHNIDCKQYQNMLNNDLKLSFKNNEQLYGLYMLAEGHVKAAIALQDSVRKVINSKIESAGGQLELEKFNVTLSIREIMKDSFPVKIAIENNVLDEKNCKILIGQFRKDIKGTHLVEHMTKVPFQKKLIIENKKSSSIW